MLGERTLAIFYLRASSPSNKTHTCEAHLLRRRTWQASNRHIKPPLHIDIRPANAPIVHRDHISGNVGIVARQRRADPPASVRHKLEIGARERSAATHGGEVATWLSDFFPADESVFAIEDSNVGIAAVRTNGRADPVDVAVSAFGTDLRRGLRREFGLFVCEHCHGDAAAVGAVLGGRVARAHPSVLCQVSRPARDPSDDVVG